MRPITSSEPRFSVSGLGADALPASALAKSALQLTRAAIARWSGSRLPAGALVREVPRVSPQARWLADAQFGLADWIARGGFAQPDEGTAAITPLAPPAMQELSRASACIE